MFVGLYQINLELISRKEDSMYLDASHSIRSSVFLLFFVCSAAAIASENSPRRSHQMLGSPLLTNLNINNLTSFYRADGQGNHDQMDNAGGRFPRNTATCIYEDGFVWGGQTYLDAGHTVHSSQFIRVGGQTYNQGTREGWVVGSGPNGMPIPPSDPRARIYRIRRDYYFMSAAELRSDAAILYMVPENDVTQQQIQAVYNQYDTDWVGWPVDLGAPYIERNNIPGFQQPPAFGPNFNVDSLIAGSYDEPGVGANPAMAPADQVVWTVYNDLDRAATLGMYGSEPIGLEGQVTIWGYRSTGALGNLHFKRLRLINKGGVDIGGGDRGWFYIDSMYISPWSDPDIGESGNDVCGSDTTLRLGYGYNGTATDVEYQQYSLAPPAVGCRLLAGPIVDAPGDSAVLDFRRIRDKRNLPMTSFVYFSAGSPISDPPFQIYESTLKWYRMLRGFLPDDSSVPERYYPFPPGYTPGPFCLTGNPVTGSGFVDGLGTTYSLAPGDRRIVLSTGPFALAPGDTQEIVVSTIGGSGSDRFSSVSLLKLNAQTARSVFEEMVMPLAVNDEPNGVPALAALDQNFPNPFNPSTRIRFRVATSGFVTVQISNLLGQQVATLVSEYKTPGEYEVQWSSRDNASGLYLCRLRSGNFVATRKLLLLR